MYAFRPLRNARFACEADFASGAYLNLHFRDEERAAIPFHLSLRRDEGMIVVNRRDAAGWRREICLPHRFQRRVTPVELHFAPGHVIVWVDGLRLGRFDAFPRPDRGGRFLLRRGFPALGTIALVEAEGACRADSVRIVAGDDGPEGAVRGLHLDAMLNLALDGLSPGDVARMAAAGGPPTLHAEGIDEVLPARLRHRPSARGGTEVTLVAPLPGRLWAGAGASLRLTLRAPGGAELGALTLDRAMMAARIGAAAGTGALAQGDRLALTAFEHVRHGDLLHRLTPPQRAALVAAAERFGLGGYLLPEGAAPAAGPSAPAARAEDPAGAALTEMRRRFGAEIGRFGDRPAALVEQLLDEGTLPEAAVPDLLIALTEWFCLTDRLPELARLWRDRDLPPAAGFLDGTPWKQSALLPLIHAEGDFAQLAETLWALAQARRGWVVTPALGWIAARLAQDAPDDRGRMPGPEQRRVLVGALLSWIDAQAPEYWSQIPCLRLIDGMVTLLEGWRGLASDQRQALEWTLLRAFGLMPAFWERVAAGGGPDGPDLPPLLHEGRAAFDRLARAIASDAATPATQADIDSALGFFQHVGNVDYLRFRRDLLGPAGQRLEQGRLPGRETGLKAGVDPLDAAVRVAAHPETVPCDADLPPGFATLLREGIAAAYDRVPSSPFADLQAALFDCALAMLDAGGGDGGGDPAPVDAVLGAIAPLATHRAGFVGLGVAVSAVRGLLDRGRDADAARIADRTGQLCALIAEPWERAALAEATAPCMAVQALRRAHPAHPLTRRLGAALGVDAGALPPDPLEDRTADLLAGANPVLNTLVAIYSCQPNLPTRVQAIRDGWAAQLAALGIPYLVFVGGGDGRRVGDVVYLDAPDSYEALPQKSLALARWVLEHTGFSHVHKIDDDCFLDAREFHGGLSPLKSDYHGRPLTRRRGDMDRAWHMAKAQTARGRLELDKSPEPSVYADGSTSWVLSRRGMERLIAAADSPEGRDLIGVSFMEDKLVGDLLATRGIQVDGEDFRVAVLRRTRPGGPLVPQWENGFLPFAGSGIKLAHLDGSERQAETLAASRRPWPQGAKVWPSYQKARFGWNTNTLDLVSSRDRLRRVNEAPVTVVACLRNEAFLLARFLDHYRALGVKGFLIADNGSDDGGFEFLADQPDVALFAVDTDYGQSHYGVAWQQALMANFRCGRWSLVADADEFLFWTPDLHGSLPDLTATLEGEGADAARVLMLDMYPGGPLSEADFRRADPFAQAPFVDREPFLENGGARGPFSNGPVWTSALRHRLIPGSRPDLFVAQKYALLRYRPWMRLSAGLHFAANIRLARQELVFGHFKYNAAFRAKAQAEVARKQHFNDAEEYRKYLALVSEGRETVFDPALSVRWDACAAVRRRLAVP